MHESRPTSSASCKKTIPWLDCDAEIPIGYARNYIAGNGVIVAMLPDHGFTIFISAITHEDYVFIKASAFSGSEGRSIYQMSLNVSDPTRAVKIVQQTDDISNVGFIYNYVTRSVIWAYGNDIKSWSLDDNSITTLTDMCKYSAFENIVFTRSLHVI